MSTPRNDAIDCRWRRRDDDAGQHCCSLLETLSGVAGPQLCTVGDDACAACVKWYPPSPEHINPVVASLLYTLTAQVLQAGGVSGCSAEKAAALHALAISAVPNDFDAVPVTDQIDSQRNVDVADIGELIPRPRRRFGPRVREWGVAVTTAPREQATLERCLAGLLASGWNDPRIIVDGELPIPAPWERLAVTRRIPRVGAWPSYYLTLIELMMRQPKADAYLIVQDDVVLFGHPGLRSYVESVLWPDETPGIVSLFCSRAYAREEPGWHRLDEPLGWGGQALIFAREAAIHLVSDPAIVRHRFAEGDRGLVDIDGLIGRWAYETDTPVHVSSSSLSQHIGHVSTLWQDSRAFINRSAAAFAGQWLPPDGRDGPSADRSP